MHLPPEEGVHSDFMYLSVCEPLSFPAGSPAAVCNGKSACRVTDGKAEVYAEFSANASNVVVSEGWIFVKGNQCAGSSNTNYKISIRVSCAAHLVSYSRFPSFFFIFKYKLSHCTSLGCLRFAINVDSKALLPIDLQCNWAQIFAMAVGGV